jgi:hypothetical protein
MAGMPNPEHDDSSSVSFAGNLRSTAERPGIRNPARPSQWRKTATAPIITSEAVSTRNPRRLLPSTNALGARKYRRQKYSAAHHRSKAVDNSDPVVHKSPLPTAAAESCWASVALRQQAPILKWRIDRTAIARLDDESPLPQTHRAERERDWKPHVHLSIFPP